MSLQVTEQPPAAAPPPAANEAKPRPMAEETGSWQPASELATIRLDPYFQCFLPPPSKDGEAKLADSVFRDGVAEPLIVWLWKGKRILIVGYDLFPVLCKHRLPFRLVEKEFPHREASRLFLIRYFTAQRLLTPLHMSYLRGQYYLAHKGSHGGDRKSEEARKQHNNRTGKSMAEMFGVNKVTLFHNARFAKAVDDIAKAMKRTDLKEDVVPHLLANVTRGRIMALRGVDPEEQKRVLKELILTGKMPQARSTRSKTITLPRDPKKMVIAIESRLGREHLETLGGIIEERLQQSVAVRA